MTNSHLLGFVTFGAFALAAIAAWVVSLKHPEIAKDRAKQRSTQYKALLLFLFGAAFGYGAFAIDNQMRVTTLHEVMVDGNIGMTAGTPAPVRQVAFTVEHPGIQHDLFLSPAADALKPPTSDVNLAFSLQGPDGKTALPETTENFAVREATEDRHADWDGRTFHFTPTAAGPHTLQIKPLTAGIPRVHVFITDPKKRDGKRLPGY